MEALETVEVAIIGKTYRFKCAASERNNLLKVARELDEKMKKIHDRGLVTRTEHIAITVALNLMNEMRQSGVTSSVSAKQEASATASHETTTTTPEQQGQLFEIERKITAALNEHEEIGV